MWIIETTTDGTATSWELSKAVPRDKAGNPVEEGPLEPGSRGERAVIGAHTTLPTLVAFLKERSGDVVRVSDVETAWAAAERSGSAAERTIRVRGGAAPARASGGPAAPAVRPDSVRSPGRSAPPSPWKGVAMLVVLGIVAYALFQFIK